MRDLRRNFQWRVAYQSRWNMRPTRHWILADRIYRPGKFMRKIHPVWRTALTIFDNSSPLSWYNFRENGKEREEKGREGRERKYDFLQISRLSSKKALFLRLCAYSCVVKYRDSLFTRNQSANNTWTIFNFNFQWHTQHPNFDAISCTLLPPLSNTWLN